MIPRRSLLPSHSSGLSLGIVSLSCVCFAICGPKASARLLTSRHVSLAPPSNPLHKPPVSAWRGETRTRMPLPTLSPQIKQSPKEFREYIFMWNYKPSSERILRIIKKNNNNKKVPWQIGKQQTLTQSTQFLEMLKEQVSFWHAGFSSQKPF